MGRVFLGPALLAAAALFAVSATTTLGQTALPAEEFAGPFSSWKQVQCSGVDDTTLLQNELNTVGKPGYSHVLYIKPGTCRITRTLLLAGRDGVSILGANPATTKIVWGGAGGGTMFRVKGATHSRFGRLTWDHNNTDGITIDDGGDNTTTPNFETDNRWEDNVFTNLPVGANGKMNLHVRLGAYNVPTAETTWIRNTFTGGQAGMYFRSFNILDHWVWDSLFQNSRYGVTTYIDGSGEKGAGGYAVNRSVFLNNVIDLGMSNTNFMSERWSYSSGAKSAHFQETNVGSPINPMTFQGNHVYSAGDATGHAPIQSGSPGPFAFLDNTFLSSRPIDLYQAYAPDRQAEILSVGNTFSSLIPYSVSSGTRLHRVDDKLGVALTHPGPPARPATPQSMNRPVIEPATRDSAGVQAAINKAAASGTRAIVHLAHGDWYFTSTVTIPASASLQLVGDGVDATMVGGTANPLISVSGPSQPVLRDFTLNGKGQQGVVIATANQPNGLVHFEDLSTNKVQIGLLVSGTNQTKVDSLDSQVAETTTAAYRATGGGILRIFNGASCCTSGSIYDVQGGSTIVSQNMYFENGSPGQLIAPNGNGTVVADVGKVDGKPGTAANASTFTGTALLQNLFGMNGAPLVGGANALLFGNTSSSNPTDSSTKYVNWGGRHDAGGGATTEIAEKAVGVTDTVGFARAHEAALRAAVPEPLTDRGTGVTNARIYRVNGQNLGTVFTVTSAAH
jgi:hypothetical protein